MDLHRRHLATLRRAGDSANEQMSRSAPCSPLPEAGSGEVVCIGGLPIARLDSRQVADRIFEAMRRGSGGWLVTANVDFVQRARSDPAIGAVYGQADLILADGAPLVWVARLQGRPVPERVAGSDLVWQLAERAVREGRSLYLLGGEGRSAELAARRLLERWPDLRIAGWSSPRVSLPPTGSEVAAIREELLRARPDLVYVAFGSPKQELLIDHLRSDLPGAWMMGCGISLSFIAGEIRRAPRWMQRSGLEWVHRMFQEPARLGRRYLLMNLPFALRLLLGALGSHTRAAQGPRTAAPPRGTSARIDSP